MKGIWRNILDILEYKAALQALVDACQEAYDVLPEADKALEDVVAAVSQMKVV